MTSTPEEIEFLKLAILKLSYYVKSQEQKVLHWKNSGDTGTEMTVLFVTLHKCFMNFQVDIDDTLKCDD